MLDGLYLGVDCGTQGLKTLVLDGAKAARGAPDAVLASARRRYGTIAGLPHGASEQHPRLWISAAQATIREVLEKIGKERVRVRAIAVSGQQHGMVVLDDRGRVLRPAKLWNDVSTAPEAKSLVEACGGAEAVRRITGNALPPGFTASKVLWLKRTEPQRFERCATVLLPHDYLNFWLTGERATEAGDASGTGYFDVRRREYAASVMSAIDPDFARRTPRVVAAGAAIGRVSQARATELGLPAGVLVGHGGGDNMMAAMGTGNTHAGVVTVSLGTSGTAFAYSAEPIIDPLGEIAAFCDSTGGHLPLVCIQNCTNTTELVKRVLKFNDGALDREASRVPPGARGASLLPFFTGERTPNLPDASAALFGLTPLSFTRECLARAAMEAPALQLGYGLDRLRGLGLRPSEVRLTGGGSHSATWRQICADVFGVPVVGLAVDEGAAFGAALCAAWCAGRADGSTSAADEITKMCVRLDERTRATPVPDHVERYREIQRTREQVLASLTPLFPKLRGRGTS